MRQAAQTVLDGTSADISGVLPKAAVTVSDDSGATDEDIVQ
jgi:hypothetical protein